MINSQKNAIIQFLTKKQNFISELLNEILKKSEYDPENFFESFSMRGIEYSAKLQVIKKYLKYMQLCNLSISNILDEMMTEVIRLAQSPLRSTCPINRLIHECKTAATADLLSEIIKISKATEPTL